uniref:thrombopoietin receptor isoform X2 n=1 Tax=Semicossyphus pulcher TaxID=241346 RepID=UPI0037E79D50
MHGKDGTVNHLSKEADSNRTYDLLYKIVSLPGENRCEMSVQRTEEGTFLHICSFPALDVFIFVDTELAVVEHNTNSSLYNRTVSVEDHFLLDPPFNTSLHHTGKAGQLQVLWHSKIPQYSEDGPIYRIKYSSKGMGEKIKEKDKEGDILDSLVPGEEVQVQVQVRVKRAYNPEAGHWSGWSRPVRAVVPQSAEDISLMCFTSDLQYVTCQWNGSRYGYQTEYKLFYQMGLSKAVGWTEWAECLANGNLTDLCRFHGDESRKVRVKLSTTAAPLSRTFYTQEFTPNAIIKTSPPGHLRAAMEGEKLFLKWEAPLPSLSAHLRYEVGYQIRGGADWMTRLLKGPETSTSLDVPTGRLFSVKLRAKPDGSVYSGHWSDWSDVLTGDMPADRGLLLMLYIPVSVLTTAITLMSLFYKYHRKLKLYFWPPVPNLDKVLQGFLTEINGQKWDPPITPKQCSEETMSSLVEIMSEYEVSGLGKPTQESTQLLSLESGLSIREQAAGRLGTEVFPDYVTLNKDSVILCQKGNKYVYEQVGEKEGAMVEDELLQTRPSSCSDDSGCGSPCLGDNFLNHSYLALAESADPFDCKVSAARGPGNIYTNLP